MAKHPRTTTCTIFSKRSGVPINHGGEVCAMCTTETVKSSLVQSDFEDAAIVIELPIQIYVHFRCRNRPFAKYILYTVVVKRKFTFCNRTTIVQRSSYGTKTVQKTVLNYYYVSVYAHRLYGTQA